MNDTPLTGKALREERMKRHNFTPTAKAYREMRGFAKDLEREARQLQAFVDSFDDDTVTEDTWDAFDSHLPGEIVSQMSKAAHRISGNAVSATTSVMIELSHQRRKEQEAKS